MACQTTYVTESSTRIIDHIVHLTPPGSIPETSEQFRRLGFNVIPGGTHSDGLTSNALVILADGVYLELISFTHTSSHYPPGSDERQKRDSHPWASMNPGWVDYAFLGNGSRTERISDIINNRAKLEGSGTVYLPEVAGGRKRPDGRVLRWIISSPQIESRGTLPFFCGDVTSRDLRVPSDPPSNTEHPSTAQGIGYVRILTSSNTLMPVSRQITSVIGSSPAFSTGCEVTWLLDTITSTCGNTKLILSAPANDSEFRFVGQVGMGIYEVAFRVKTGGGSENTPYGKIVWVLIQESCDATVSNISSVQMSIVE